MRNFALAALFAATASVASAASLQIDEAPTPDLDGYTTFTLSIVLDAGETFRGVDATFDGPMNQVNPFASATIFNDFNNTLFPPAGADPAQDSQFSFASTDVLSIGTEESATSLVGALSGLPDFAETTIQFAQIASIPNDVTYRLAFDLGGPEPALFEGVLGIPEPSTALLAGLALAGFVARRK